MKFDYEKTVYACQRKESDAQKCLYDHFAAALMGVCRRYISSPDDAQDVFQEGFLKIFENIGQLKAPAALWDWMKRIMINESINFLMRKKWLTYVDMSSVEDEFGDTEEGEPFDTDGYDVDKVIAALYRLPDKYRVVFNMREVEEMEFADIAQIVGLSESGVRSMASRARNMLKDKLMKKI